MFIITHEGLEELKRVLTGEYGLDIGKIAGASLGNLAGALNEHGIKTVDLSADLSAYSALVVLGLGYFAPRQADLAIINAVGKRIGVVAQVPYESGTDAVLRVAGYSFKDHKLDAENTMRVYELKQG